MRTKFWTSPFWAIVGLGATFGLYTYFQCKIWRWILARRPRFPIRVTKFAPISLSYRDPHFGLFWGLGFLGVFSYFRCKIWRHILALWPWFPMRGRNFAPISPNFRDLTRDRQTADRRQTTDRQTDRQTDRRGDRNRRLSHCKCASLIIIWIRPHGSTGWLKKVGYRLWWIFQQSIFFRILSLLHSAENLQ